MTAHVNRGLPLGGQALISVLANSLSHYLCLSWIKSKDFNKGRREGRPNSTKDEGFPEFPGIGSSHLSLGFTSTSLW